MKVFFCKRRKLQGPNDFDLPKGEAYKPFYEAMITWMKQIRAMPHETIKIKSYDGLTLCGKYYEYKKGAPVELLFHGYQGTGERDLSGGVERCFSIGRNAVIIDQRGHGESEGHTTTFGIKERRDCLKWIEWAVEYFGKDTKIIITGISMGAATVSMAAGEDLPDNVVCVLADCGYSSAKDIIKKVINDMKLPSGLLYPFVKLGARIFGGFDLEETSPEEAVKKAKVPMIFIHGDTDDFVPCEMSQKLYECCASKDKRFVIIPGAGHGLAFPTEKNLYLKSLIEFENESGFLR
jgi:alpha-beta hydrolase superfamily lysophospholipase